MDLRRRFGIGHVDRIVAVDREPARAAELAIFGDELAVLGQDLDAVVVAVGDDQPPKSTRAAAMEQAAR